MKSKMSKNKLIVLFSLILFSIKVYAETKIKPLKLLTPEKK